MKIRLVHDSRDYEHYQHFGQVVAFPDEFNVDSSMPDAVQPIGDVTCTEYTTYDIATDDNGLTYVPHDLFDRVEHDRFGADPHKILSKAVSKEADGGLLPQGQTERIRPFASFWSAHTGVRDAFDNVRSAMMLAKLPVAVWSNWYDNWNCGLGNVMPVGDKVLSAHMYDVQGWIQKNGEPMLVVQSWEGGVKYMPRATFNAALNAWGCGTAVLSTTEIDEKRTKTILETMKDLCINTILLIKQFLILKGRPVINESTTDDNVTIKEESVNSQEKVKPTITDWAKAIEVAEGNASYLHNPGSLKVSPLTASWGAKNGVQASDGGWIARFDTYDTGFQALCNFLTLGCHDELKAFHNARTLQQFSEVYGGNPPQGYINTIGNMLHLPLDTDISIFLE